MENTKKKSKKKLLIAKIVIVLSIVLLISLFCVVIAQTVKVNRLSEELEKQNQTYKSTTTQSTISEE